MIAMFITRGAIALLIAVSGVWGQGAPAETDPPSRVARLSYQSGTVSFRPGTVDEWGSATLNYPLTTGDQLWTNRDSRAEIQAGLAAIRMAPETALSILNLDDRTIQVSVTQGTLQIHVRSLEPDETIEVATPNVAVTLLRPGDYRIDADPDHETTTVTVRGGDAAVTGGGIAFPVHARQTARIRGLETVKEEVGAEIPVDEFERWAVSRDQLEEQSISAQYVPREMTGYQELDDSGAWSDEPDYGPVWTPRTVAVDWAPYRYGQWRWIEPWGWTWIDDAPWGFTTCHYGRWAMLRGVWVWVPGRRTPGIRPVYAPALVVFVGGPRFGISHAAWFPLGPREVYRPGYRTSERYLRNINMTHTTNINVTSVRYMNHRMGAVSAADRDAFVKSRRIGRDGARIDAREIDESRVVGTAPAIPPRRESIVTAPVRQMPPARAERTVVVRTTAPARPVPFAVRQRVLEVNEGHPLDQSQVETLRRDVPARPSMVRVAIPPRQAPAPQADWPRRVDAPRAVEQPRRVEERQVESPRRVEPPRAEPPRPVETPRVVEQPRRVEERPVETPRRVEVPRAESPRREEQPRRVVEQPRREEPRQVEAPRRVEAPRAESPRPVEPPRREEQPRQVERPRREEPRQVESPRPVERPRREEQPRQVERPRPEQRPAEHQAEQPSRGEGRKERERRPEKQ